jgi:hypothetical protein
MLLLAVFPVLESAGSRQAFWEASQKKMMNKL